MLDEHMGPIKKYSILTVGAVVLALANYVLSFRTILVSEV